MRREPTRNCWEDDSISGWRKVIIFRSGERSWAKRNLRRRERRKAKLAIRAELSDLGG